MFSASPRLHRPQNPYTSPNANSSTINHNATGNNNTTSGTHNSDHGLFSKLGTLAKLRKKRAEADQLLAEANKAMQDPLHPVADEHDPSWYNLAEGEERSMIEPYSKEHPLVQELTENLIGWINEELQHERIIIRNLEEDIYDGQILQMLTEKFTGMEINQPEIIQTEMGQRQRLVQVIDIINQALGLSTEQPLVMWTPALIHSKDLVAILRLLVAMYNRFCNKSKLPSGVHLTVIVVRKINGILQHRRMAEPVTDFDENTECQERDAISALVDCAVGEKLVAFQNTLIDFVNSHLVKLNLSVKNLDTEMEDGVYFILLMGLLRNYFVPIHSYFIAPINNEQKQANLQLVLRLMEETEGYSLWRANDLLKHDLKATLRLVYYLYSKYKEN